jgi:hypothetical protein
MATLATGLPATALTGLDLHQLDFNKRFRHLIMVPPLPRFPSAISHFVTSMTAPTASGWSNIAGWVSHPLENAAFSRRTPIFAVSDWLSNGENAARNGYSEQAIWST